MNAYNNKTANSLKQILAEDPRYQANAYYFLREALNYTLKRAKKHKTKAIRHVSCADLLEGIRRYALQEYGPVSKTVLNTWGVFTCEDFWYIISNLEKKGVLKLSKEDSIIDFENGYDFHSAFRTPFEPDKTAKQPHKG